VDAPVQYGPRIAAIVVYLYVGQFLSKKRTGQALAELFGTPLSGGTVAAFTKRAAARLDGFLAHVRDRLIESEVVGFDETGLRVAGNTPTPSRRSPNWPTRATSPTSTNTAHTATALRYLTQPTTSATNPCWCCGPTMCS
jgi:hypothetical protein